VVKFAANKINIEKFFELFQGLLNILLFPVQYRQDLKATPDVPFLRLIYKK